MQKKTKKIILITTLLLIILSIIIITLNINKKIPQTPQIINEQAEAKYTTIIGNQPYDITNAVLEPNDVNPTISAGMIPIRWDGANWIITNREDENWYDYTTGKPAYIMLNDGTYQSEIIQDMTNKKLAENNVGVGVPDDPNTRGTIYMWIPRFAYSAQGEILYIKQGCSVAGTYTIPEIFTYETEKRDLSLAGIWVEYNPLANTSAVNTKINDMKGPENKYGFIANTIGTNANTEASYKTTIEIYINALSTNTGTDNQWLPLQAQDNTNRTILKITNTNQLEPIKGKAYYDKEEEKIKIEVTYKTNAIEKILDRSGKELPTNSTTTDSGDEIIGNGTYKYMVIDSEGNIKEITTKVEGLKIYVIPDLETLKQFRDEVNAGNSFSGIKVIQTADIAMNEGKYRIDEQTGDVVFDEEKEPEQWTPIGDYNSIIKRTTFAGEYNGQGHTISGIYICQGQYQGLFGAMTDGKIQNLGIKESYIQGSNQLGGILGTSGITNKIITIENCYNEGTIVGTDLSGAHTGGICGAGRVNLINCYNTGNIKGNARVGGIIGSSSYGIIENCYNTGTIIPFSESGSSPGEMGGIVGYCYSSDGIKNCYNTGDIIGSEKSQRIGGIKGSGYGNVENCYNTGNISGRAYLGGICGYESDDIKNCYNIGNVSGTDRFIGGISGQTWNIENCYNVGIISGKSEVGGITGSCSKNILNTYYLEGTATYGNGSKKSDTNSEPKTEAEIKGLTAILNGDVEPENAIWVEDKNNINNGYPIFAWQMETIE